MKSWADIEAIAAERKGGQAELEALIEGANSGDFASSSEAQLLEAFALGLFAAGFRWRVVQAKRGTINEAFGGFDVDHVAGFELEDIEALAQDTRVIRNRNRIVNIHENAVFMQGVEGGLVPKLAAWPKTDLVGMYAWLKKEGSRLGGATGPRALRSLGFDTYILTGSVGDGLVAHGGFAKAPSGKRAAKQAQETFDAWHEQSGRSYTELSRILAYSIP
ncbi:MAG: 3-methyladenine DNA glycosylase [Proteobacteria bacterium]|nr:3-methyladenine DNA glycosylase [Pseudomonadota bacterium]